MFYGLQQEKVSEKLGYTKETATNVTGIWEGMYDANGLSGCLKLDVYKKMGNNTFKGVLISSDPIAIEKMPVKVTTTYIDTDYAFIKIVNEQEKTALSGKVKNSEIAKIKGTLKGVRLKEFKITKNEKLCLPSLSKKISRFEEAEYEILLKDYLYPSCYLKAKNYEKAFEGKNSLEIKPVSNNPCAITVKDPNFDKIDEQPIYQNETYIKYKNMEAYKLTPDIYLVIFQ